MNTRHIQNFLMVSTAFFAMTGPLRSQGASALAAASAPMLQITPAGDAIAPAGVTATTQVSGAPKA
ncbi:MULTISPECIES: hypothetical protein [Burkholderia]|uniref:Outer membrane protein n=1 Tax=Burkholderia gladioli TaxID=28095 RepID=A0A2A7S8W7_BURGA|nr:MULTISPECIES: hypothetical protein [Burkholderia]ATF85785.1 hypothetical protein CO712_12460 [Burkholderia gladioli pv. gladioli]MBJ9662002.1 hypothetical protein [Burkholderia gladioli]MBJ9714193.1 hypothetical protein [Burkholderia gladioli]MBU9158962.1 hypothetical protein [Burkholderia gladioli]MBU9172541.1 hypothetical protein [Burkholderia gladioli]